jgi:hypothetical protein
VCSSPVPVSAVSCSWVLASLSQAAYIPAGLLTPQLCFLLLQPLIIEKSLSRFGYKTTLQGLAVAFVVMVLAAAPFIKGRVPDSVVAATRRVTFNFVKKRSFWFLLIVSVAQGCGSELPLQSIHFEDPASDHLLRARADFMPALYLPTFATSALKLTPFQGTLVLALMNLSQAFGYPVFGRLADKHHNIGIVSSSVVAIVRDFAAGAFRLAQLTDSTFPHQALRLLPLGLLHQLRHPDSLCHRLWLRLAVRLHPSLAQSVLIPSTNAPAGVCLRRSYGAFWSPFTTIAQGDPSEQILLFSVFVATRGAGNLASGPLAAALLNASTGSSFSSASGAYGIDSGRWGATILFTGLCACVGMTASLVGFIPKGRLERKMTEERAT